MKNIIQEGLDDSGELNAKDTTNGSSAGEQKISLKPGDVLRISDISGGEIVLSIETSSRKKTMDEKDMEEESEGSYKWRGD